MTLSGLLQPSHDSVQVLVGPQSGWLWLLRSVVLLTNVLDELLLSVGAKASLDSGKELNMIY